MSVEKPLIDSHCHLDLIMERGSSPDEIKQSLYENNIKAVVQIASDPGSMEFSPVFCRENTAEVQYFYTIGLHPNEAHELDIQSGLQSIKKNAADERFVAVGEVGLDYYYSAQHRLLQLETFEKYILAACDEKKPVVVHTRNAHEDTLELIKKYSSSTGFLIHCFTGNISEMKNFLDHGAYISFSGIVTFKNATDVQEAAKVCPKDRMIIETDSPYLAPVPHRGKINLPGWVRNVADFLSELRQEDIHTSSFENTKKFFNLNI